MVKKIVGGIVGLTVVVGLPVFVYLLTNNKLSMGYNIGYEPTQPVPFSHKLHAGDNKIDCKYCHTNVGVSRNSAVPSLNICMNCHLSVATGSEEIQKLQKNYAEGKSIPWVKVHMLPDHVKFNHSKHIIAGKQCSTCHGEIEKMEKVYQYSDLSMGWCVNCHRGDPNYDPQLTEEEIKKYNGSDHSQAPLNCSTCHY